MDRKSCRLETMSGVFDSVVNLMPAPQVWTFSMHSFPLFPRSDWMLHNMKLYEHWTTRRLFVALMWIWLTTPALAETTIEGRALLFYTDDVGVFSATRRLTRDDDPTQPAIDTRLTDKGSDVVFEPDAILRTSFNNRLGTTLLSVRGQGFVYADNPRFNHGTLNIQAIQAFSAETRVRFRYYYAPNLFLGENEDRRPGEEGLVDESVTSHIWSARLEQRLTPTLEVRLLSRYGIRRYNDAFAQRDTDF